MNKSLAGIRIFFFAVASIAFQYCCSVPATHQFVLTSVESATDSFQYNLDNSDLNRQVDSVLLLKHLYPFLPVDDTPRLAKSGNAEAKKVEKNDQLSAIAESGTSYCLFRDTLSVLDLSFCFNENDNFQNLLAFYTPYRGPPSFFLT